MKPDSMLHYVGGMRLWMQCWPFVIKPDRKSIKPLYVY